MSTTQIEQAIEKEISRLQGALQILRGSKPHASRRGAKRVLSPEARQRIVDAQKRRWAKARKAA